MTPVDIPALTAGETADLYRAGELSPVEAAEGLLERIEALDAAVNAFCHLDADMTLAQARAAEVRFAAGEPLSPIDGIAVAVKDTFLTAGWPTLKGSRLVDRTQPWTDDAPAVARLREAGAVLVGKTTMPEFGWKGLCDSPLTGTTRNPWDLRMTPGGSSGGSAAALAAGMAPLALGTDGGGSIRIPGAFTGTVGIKPTYGRVPYWPMSPFGALAHAGPMARTVEDMALLHQVVARYDRRDFTALPDTDVDVRAALDGGVQGLRIAFSPTLGYADVDGDVAELVAEAAAVVEGLGAVVEPADPPMSDARVPWETLWNAGAAAVVDGLDPDHHGLLDAGLAEIAAAGRRLTAVEYLEAFRGSIDIADALGGMLTDYDALMTPTMPIPAFEVDVEVPPGWSYRRWQSWSPFSIPFNLSQQPAITVPCGITATGLPVGLQIVAAKHRDDLVVRVAAAYEAARAADGERFVRPLDASRVVTASDPDTERDDSP